MVRRIDPAIPRGKPERRGSRGHGGFFYDRILQPLLLKEVYKDKDRQEAVVRESGMQWTLIRPGALKNGPGNGKYRVLTDLNGITIGSIARADVAGRAADPSASALTYWLYSRKWWTRQGLNL